MIIQFYWFIQENWKKEKTKEILRALKQIPEANLKLIIIGSIPEEGQVGAGTYVGRRCASGILGMENAEKLREYLAVQICIYNQGHSQLRL